ncbi:MAG: hypothetical protein ACI9A7_000262 [Cyclobacteriaceae bacterium]|jgi:hypothetical protein
MMKSRFRILVILFLSVSFVDAQNAERTEKLSRTFEVNGRILKVINSFGDIELRNWNKNQIFIEIEITAKANNDDKVTRLLNKIDIDIEENSSSIHYETNLKGLASKNSESFKIKYTIHLPSTVDVVLKQSFGDIIIDSRLGSSDIEVAYGNLKATDFESLDLKLSFGAGVMTSAVNAEIELSYSNFSIEKIKQLKMVEKFSEVEINEVDMLDMRGNYGDVSLQQVSIADIDAQFTGLKIGALTKSLVLKANYVSGFEIREVSPDFELIDISSKFSELELHLGDGLKAIFEGEFSFANLKDYAGIDYSFRSKDHNDSEYRGSINGGDSTKKIIVESSYGDLKLK